MPVHVVRDGDKYCIEDDQGKRHGTCHETEERAQAQSRAINANSDKEAANGLVDNIIRRVNEILGKGETRPREDVPCTDCQDSEVVTTPEEKAVTGLMTWKGDDGRWYWLARYSNSYRDDDRPKQEIISAQSHNAFVKNIDEGVWEYPELWYWHEKSWKWGETTFVAFDELEPGKGFALAGGPVDEGKEWMAEKFQNPPVNHGVSHGMPSEYIVRNKADDTIYDGHRTVEISPLPLDRAANKYTGFTVFTKEKDIMALSDEKRRQAAASLGASEEALRLVEQSNAEAAKAADAEGREFKEAGEAEVQEPEAPEAEVEVAPEPEPAEEKESPEYITRKDFNEFAAELTRGFTDAMKIVNESLESLRAEVAKVQEEKEELEKSMTPAASIYSHILSAVGGQQVKQVEDLKDQAPSESPIIGTGRTRNPGIAFLSQMEDMNKRAAGVR